MLFDETNYISKNVNYELVFGICPANCHLKGAVIGRTLHHPESAVCASAIADFSMPKHGGVIGYFF